jgi:hypothetical protein
MFFSAIFGKYSKKIFFFVEYLPADSRKRQNNVGLPQVCISQSNHTVFIDMHIVTYLTTRNMDNFESHN